MIRLRSSRPISLTLRVLLFVTAAIGLSLLLNAALILSSIKHHFVEQDADELRVITQSIAHALRQANRNATQLSDALSHAVSGHHGVYYQVENKAGQLLYRTQGTDFAQSTESFPPVQVINGDSLRIWQSDGKIYRGVVTPVSSGSEEFRVTAAIDMDFHLQFLIGFRESLWLIMLGTGIVTLLATWFGIHQGHLPLRGLSRSMREIQTNRLHVRVDPDTVPIELEELVQSFNHMIGRLEEGFERLSHFSSDIAHELRTPLTNLITQAQVTLSKVREPEAYRELLYSSLEELERLAKMVGDMLWLAKCDNDLIKPVLVPLDLAQEFRELFDFFGALAAENRIELALEGHAPEIEADRELLRRALSNLLSNAIRHTPVGGTVRVSLAVSEDGMIKVSVANPGIDITPEHLPKLFDRFYRVDPSRQRQSEGTGLGLAIAKSIIESHDGHLTVQSAHGMTTFAFTLPNLK
jgi:two-component system heavy metal sensor histidine kinase CusS